MKSWLNIVLVVGGLTALAGLIWVVSGATPQQDQPSDRVVAATVFPLADLVSHVAGDEVDVVTLLPSGASPHTFEPSARTLRDLSDAQVGFSIGNGLDNWMEDLADGINLPVIEVSDGINLIEGADEEEVEADHESFGMDPHYWLSIPNAITMVGTITEDLSQTYPDLAPTFEANSQAYITRLEAADAEIRSTLAGVNNKNIVTFHNSFPYFAQEYGLKIAGSVEPSGGVEPTPRYLQNLQDVTRAAGVDVVYSEPQLSTANLKPFVGDLGLKIAELDPLGGGEGRDSYILLMRYNAETIAANQ